MMKGKIYGLLLLLALALFPAPALAGEKILARIERFLTVLDSNPSYFNSQHYDFFEREMTIVEKLCGDNLNLPQSEREICEDTRNKRLRDDRKTPSLLLLWLGTKLPKRPTVTIVKNEWKPQRSRHIITAKLDNTITVLEMYDIGPSYKPLIVRSINGEDIFDIVDKDIEDGLSLSSLLKKTKK